MKVVHVIIVLVSMYQMFVLRCDTLVLDTVYTEFRQMMMMMMMMRALVKGLFVCHTIPAQLALHSDAQLYIANCIFVQH